MPFEEPAVSRISVEEGVNEIRFTIPVRREWGVVLFLGFWLCGWAVGELFAISALAGIVRDTFSGGAAFADFFILFWLCVWTVGGAAVIYGWLNVLGVREIITVDAERLQTTYAVPGLSRTKEYRAADITDLRVRRRGHNRPKGRNPFTPPGGAGRIEFIYGDTAVFFGENVSESEARMIVERIAQRFPAIVAREGS